MLLLKHAKLLNGLEGFVLRDVLIGGGKILAIGEDINVRLCGLGKQAESIDLDGRLLIPGIIDQHLHITGGGADLQPFGEIDSITADEILENGVTTVVGAPAIDTHAKPLMGVLQKAKGLVSHGVTAYMYTGSFGFPLKSITGTVERDLVLIDRVLGVKIALGDPLGGCPSPSDISRLLGVAYRTRLCTGKAAVVHSHLGHNPEGLDLVYKIYSEHAFPYDLFIPTHSNCDPDVLRAAEDFAIAGGYLDISTIYNRDLGSPRAVKPSRAVVEAIEKGVDPAHITLSSDGNVAVRDPLSDKIRREGEGTLLKEFQDLILKEGVPVGLSASFVTSNPATVLGLGNTKGHITVGADADLVVLSDTYSVDKVFSKGMLRVNGLE